MIKVLISIVLSVMLAGCSSLVKPEERIITEEVFVEKIPLELSMPRQLIGKTSNLLL